MGVSPLCVEELVNRRVARPDGGTCGLRSLPEQNDASRNENEREESKAYLVRLVGRLPSVRVGIHKLPFDADENRQSQ